MSKFANRQLGITNSWDDKENKQETKRKDYLVHLNVLFA